MKHFKGLMFLGAIAMLCILRVQAQSITISGEGLQPFTIDAATFHDMKQSVVMAKAHDGSVHRYTGVSMADLLAKAGVLLGDTAKKQNVMSYVVVTAADNYKAMYTMAEVDTLFANRVIIVADKSDKKPLTPEDGPFQIIVPGEKKHGRWVRQVNSIQLFVVK